MVNCVINRWLGESLSGLRVLARWEGLLQVGLAGRVWALCGKILAAAGGFLIVTGLKNVLMLLGLMGTSHLGSQADLLGSECASGILNFVIRYILMVRHRLELSLMDGTWRIILGYFFLIIDF